MLFRWLHRLLRGKPCAVATVITDTWTVHTPVRKQQFILRVLSLTKWSGSLICTQGGRYNKGACFTALPAHHRTTSLMRYHIIGIQYWVRPIFSCAHLPSCQVSVHMSSLHWLLISPKQQKKIKRAFLKQSACSYSVFSLVSLLACFCEVAFQLLQEIFQLMWYKALLKCLTLY